MTARLSIGIGCRRGIDPEAIIASVRAALDARGLSTQDAELFTIADKQNEGGLAEAAAALGVPLKYIARDVLAAIPTPTRSERTLAMFGVSSIAESAALAGAGPGATLLVERIARDGVTCAIARARL